MWAPWGGRSNLELRRADPASRAAPALAFLAAGAPPAPDSPESGGGSGGWGWGRRRLLSFGPQLPRALLLSALPSLGPPPLWRLKSAVQGGLREGLGGGGGGESLGKGNEPFFPGRKWKLTGILGPEGSQPPHPRRIPRVQNLGSVALYPLEGIGGNCLGRISCFGLCGQHGPLGFLPLGLRVCAGPAGGVSV